MPLNVAEALGRARRMTLVKARYKLGAGGRDPKAAHPLTTRDGILGCDCSGFVRWCWQIDRWQPKWFQWYDGWINCDSLILAGDRGAAPLANETKNRFKTVHVREVLPGDAVVFPSIWKNGKRIRVGHEGIVVDVPVEQPKPGEWEHIYSKKDKEAYLKGIKVIDCNASLVRKVKGYAIGETTAYALWNKSDARFVRFLGLPES